MLARQGCRHLGPPDVTQGAAAPAQTGACNGGGGVSTQRGRSLGKHAGVAVCRLAPRQFTRHTHGHTAGGRAHAAPAPGLHAEFCPLAHDRVTLGRDRPCGEVWPRRLLELGFRASEIRPEWLLQVLRARCWNRTRVRGALRGGLWPPAPCPPAPQGCLWKATPEPPATTLLTSSRGTGSLS